MKLRAVVLVGVGVVVAGCSSSNSDPSPLDAIAVERERQAVAPVCVEVYAPGVVTSAEHADAGCMDGGSLRVGGVTVEPCADGRTLVWSDLGWGFVGDPWSAHDPGAEQVAPAEAREACGL